MSYFYSDGNLMNNTESILQVMKAQQAEKRVFGNSVLAELNNDSFTKTTNPFNQKTSANNANDGKISFKEKITNFGKGFISPLKNMISSPKNIALTALSVAAGAGLIALTGGAAAPVMVATGLIGGGVQIGKGIYKQAKATTDEQARQAWQQMGSGTFTVGASAAGAKSALKANGVDVKGMSTLKASAKCIVDTPKNIVKGVSTASGKISAFMSSANATAQPSATSTTPETTTKTNKETMVDTQETKPATQPSKETTAQTTETVVKDTPKTVAETPDVPSEIKEVPDVKISQTQPKKPIVEQSEISTVEAPVKTEITETVADVDVNMKNSTKQTPVEKNIVETIEVETPAQTDISTTATIETPATNIEVSQNNQALEVSQNIAKETTAVNAKPVRKKIVEPKNYVQEILLPNGRIVKIDMTPKPYSELILDRYKAILDQAKAEEIKLAKENVSVLNKFKNILKTFGFFK